MSYFTVRSTNSGKTHESFATRQAAKKLRDELNGGKWSDENTKREFVVSRTAQHRYGASKET